MELRQLKYFIAIADCGAFSKAADRVFIAQSALSHQIAQLEDELGASLFHRSRRGVELTDAGSRFLPHAVSILRQSDNAVASVRSGASAPSGKVVFGIPHSASNALALPLLRAVREQLPLVQLELTEELTGNLSKQLRTGQINLAVLFDDGHLGEFACTPLLRERMCLIEPAQAIPTKVLPAGKPRKTRITLKQALAKPLTLPASPHGVRPIIEAAAAQAGLPAPVVEADISSISILRTTLLAGLGRTLLPVMPLRAEIDSGQLVATEVGSPPLARTLMLCAASHIPPSAAAQAVEELVLVLVRTLCASGEWPGAVVLNS
jgi:LysR family transcriptional regulator, nitrogen assimilation regulatory protein